MSDAIGEVVESSTRQFVAEVYDEADPPPFGTWVRVEGDRSADLFGLVSHVEVASYDQNRQAVALGMDAEERAREMPMVQELLRTTVRAQLLAVRPEGGSVRQTLPPHPPGIHDFVYACSEEHVRSVGPPYDFLRTLVENPAPDVPVDDLLVAVLGQVRAAHADGAGQGRDALIRAGRALSRLLDDDHERLQSILRRVSS
jgi:hypothetical protein